MADDTLQRTLLLAQKFVDETKADSEAQAIRIIAEADAKARQMTEQAQTKASQIAAESEQRLRDEINRLEDSRTTLTHEVESMSRHLESERNRLRTALGDILRWVDENVQPVATRWPTRRHRHRRTPGRASRRPPTRRRSSPSRAAIDRWWPRRWHRPRARPVPARVAMSPRCAPPA